MLLIPCASPNQLCARIPAVSTNINGINPVLPLLIWRKGVRGDLVQTAKLYNPTDDMDYPLMAHFVSHCNCWPGKRSELLSSSGRLR